MNDQVESITGAGSISKKHRQCDANHCSVMVPSNRGMCTKHWHMVPRDVQRRIYAACASFRTSAERLSSIEFMEAWADAVEFVAMQEGRLTRNAFRNLANWLRRRAITKGGD